MIDEMIEGDYEYETGFQIMNAFAEKGLTYEEVEMVTVANHAPFTWGKDAKKAVYNSAVLEEVAKMAWITKTVSPIAPRLKESLKMKHYERKHGKNAYYGQYRNDY
jgi:L-ribulose-5-phosphate 4-epimerase